MQNFVERIILIYILSYNASLKFHHRVSIIFLKNVCFWYCSKRIIVGTKTVRIPHCYNPLLINSYQPLRKRIVFLSFNEQITDVHSYCQMKVFQFMRNPKYRGCLRVLAYSGGRKSLNDECSTFLQSRVVSRGFDSISPLIMISLSSLSLLNRGASLRLKSSAFYNF